MPNNNACLGLCFFKKQLFYAVSKLKRSPHLSRIGAIDFNFDVARAIFTNHSDHVTGLRRSVDELKEQFNVSHIRIMLHSNIECWTMLPKLVYDDADERESYINILMYGCDRRDIYPSWHSLSKDNFKLLQLRTRDSLRGVQKLTTGFSSVEFLSAFQMGEKWIRHAHPGGSFLTVGVFGNTISISSFILGKLRGATFIPFDEAEDLPYLWLQKAQDLPWMQGLHEQIQVYGQDAHRIIEILEPFWDDAGTVTKMDTLVKMQVEADESTYGFDLALAYPAIMLALN